MNIKVCKVDQQLQSEAANATILTPSGSGWDYLVFLLLWVLHSLSTQISCYYLVIEQSLSKKEMGMPEISVKRLPTLLIWNQRY